MWVAYVLYFCGGIVGLHHVYLKRPHQCFLWSVSFGGYGVGLVRDFFAIPRYVREASECGSCRDERPSMGMAEVIGMLAFASHMGWLAKSVLPAAPSSEADHASYSLCTFALSVLGQVPYLAVMAMCDACALAQERAHLPRIARLRPTGSA